MNFKTTKHTNYILTGAGFTVNWGGWTANKFLSELVHNHKIQNNDGLKLFIAKTKNQNFESILDEIKKLAENYPKQWKEKHKIFEDAILDTFKEMEGSYSKAQFMYNYDVEESLFAQCNTIFTLNQDLLLERYLSKIARQCFHPGLKPRGHPQSFYGASFEGFHIGNDITQVYDESRLKDFDNLEKYSICIPYLKLHGSMNWRDQNSGRLMIMGANQKDQINQHNLTKKYFEIFTNKLNIPNSHLLVIGYSFSDVYVNEIIFEAILNNGLKLYVWNMLERVELENLISDKIHDINFGYKENIHDILLSLSGVYTDEIIDLIKSQETSVKIQHIARKVFI